MFSTFPRYIRNAQYRLFDDDDDNDGGARINGEVGPSELHQSAGSSQKTPPPQLQHKSPASSQTTPSPASPPSFRLAPEAPSFAIRVLS